TLYYNRMTIRLQCIIIVVFYFHVRKLRNSFTDKEVHVMNKKEILEIRRQFTPENCAITRICGCYVDHEKEKKSELKKAFLSLPEEEAFKYFDIFRHTLSGTLGKNMINMEFPLEQELSGGTQEFLLKLR